ncbi:hypothetical protein TNCV_1375761 [Trichonephila clavipes]|nr:hypothetical protein TNCV_1375761 [Trichonephila clavipes]
MHFYELINCQLLVVGRVLERHHHPLLKLFVWQDRQLLQSLNSLNRKRRVSGIDDVEDDELAGRPRSAITDQSIAKISDMKVKAKTENLQKRLPKISLIQELLPTMAAPNAELRLVEDIERLLTKFLNSNEGEKFPIGIADYPSKKSVNVLDETENDVSSLDAVGNGGPTSPIATTSLHHCPG